MKVFAHRGYSQKYPESTWLAYEKAVEAQADGFECDVRLSKDKQVICFHDRNLKRIANKNKAVSRLTAAQLRQYAQAISLEELLELAIIEKKDLLIETKHPVRSRGKIEKQVIQIVKRKSRLIEQAGIEVTLMSFSYFAVRRMKKRYRKVIKVIKYPLAYFLKPTKDFAIDFAALKKHPGIIKRSAGNRVYVWTVNDEEDLRWLKKHDVYGVITDRPKRARRILLSSHNG
jgi:glycerophosphoryl diester phosphodiesterase